MRVSTFIAFIALVVSGASAAAAAPAEGNANPARAVADAHPLGFVAARGVAAVMPQILLVFIEDELRELSSMLSFKAAPILISLSWLKAFEGAFNFTSRLYSAPSTGLNI
ncbi:hypothetical protein BDZ89DRAFT_1032238 [Hymenopellis radicata]|nr:hypothetical protein BDZ89DRAFT_1032238 [Hymenopellis radicata]